MAREDFGSRRTSSFRTLLPTVRRLGGIAPGGATRTLSGSTETSGHGITAADSCDWPHPRRSVDRSDTDAQSLPHQAAAVGLLWIGAEDVHQRRISFRRWPTQTLQEGPGRPRAQHQPQSRSNIFKGAATRAASTVGPFKDSYKVCVA